MLCQATTHRQTGATVSWHGGLPNSDRIVLRGLFLVEDSPKFGILACHETRINLHASRARRRINHLHQISRDAAGQRFRTGRTVPSSSPVNPYDRLDRIRRGSEWLFKCGKVVALKRKSADRESSSWKVSSRGVHRGWYRAFVSVTIFEIERSRTSGPPA